MGFLGHSLLQGTSNCHWHKKHLKPNQHDDMNPNNHHHPYLQVCSAVVMVYLFPSHVSYSGHLQFSRKSVFWHQNLRTPFFLSFIERRVHWTVRSKILPNSIYKISITHKCVPEKLHKIKVGKILSYSRRHTYLGLHT